MNLECNLPPALPLYSFALVYGVSSVSEVVLIKALNYWLGVYLPVYTALCLNTLWVLMIPSYYWLRERQQKRQPPTGGSADRTAPGHGAIRLEAGGKPAPSPPSRKSRVVYYAIMSVVTYLITLLRNLAVNSLPGSVVTLLLSSSIVFNMALSRVFLHRQLNAWHILAAAFCVCASISVAVFNTDTHGGEGHQYSLGVPTALCAAFMIAVSSVVTDRVTSAWPDPELELQLMTIVASIAASVLLVPTLFATGEQRLWPGQLGNAYHASAVLLVALSLGLPVAKAAVRSSKYATIQRSSAFAFEFVQAGSTLTAALVSVVLFAEAWSHGFIAAFVLMILSFAAYTKARAVMKRRHRVEHAIGTVEERSRCTVDERAPRPVLFMTDGAPGSPGTRGLATISGAGLSTSSQSSADELLLHDVHLHDQAVRSVGLGSAQRLSWDPLAGTELVPQPQLAGAKLALPRAAGFRVDPAYLGATTTTTTRNAPSVVYASRDISPQQLPGGGSFDSTADVHTAFVEDGAIVVARSLAASSDASASTAANGGTGGTGLGGAGLEPEPRTAPGGQPALGQGQPQGLSIATAVAVVQLSGTGTAEVAVRPRHDREPIV